MSTLYGALFASFLAGAPANGPISLAREVAVIEDADQQDLTEIVAHTRSLLDAFGFEATVTGRVKSQDSIYAKMRRKGLSRDAIEDRIGLRICVETEDQCYAVRDLLQSVHEPIEASEDDYIAYPKANGYQSIHTVAHTRPLGVRAEFQIRTNEMHEYAVNGPAAHWLYKMSA